MSAAAEHKSSRRGFGRDFWVVLTKEVIDALRDRRTLLRLLIPAVLLGPAVLMMLSGLISSFEAQAKKRQIVAIGMEHAPTLRNYLERQTFTIVSASGNYEQALRNSKLTSAVVVVPADFEDQLKAGERPVIEIVSDSANQRANASVGGLQRLLQGFASERASLNLALRGVSTDLLQPIDVQERDLASTQARASQITGILPMFIIMAVLYGALTAALDSTAGERERGSLEPLLMNPVTHWALVLGKWGAVALLGLTVALLSNLSFVPGQWLLKSDRLQAMFQFGAHEVLVFLALQLPLAAGMGAVLMAMAIRSKTFKEAQASSTLVLTLVSMAPMVSLMNPGGEAAWYFWVPGLAQHSLMMLVLKGESLRLLQVLPGVLTGLLLTAAGLWHVVRSMRSAVAR